MFEFQSSWTGKVVDPFEHTLTHPMVGQTADIRLGKRDALWRPEMVATSRRLIAAHKATIAQDRPLRHVNNTDLWSDLIRDNFGQLLNLVRTEDAEQLSRYLTAFGSTYTWFGGISTGVDGYTHWNIDEAFVAASYFDKLISLAEALGILSVESPEQGATGKWGHNARLSPNEIVKAIEANIGIEIVPPPGPVHVAGIPVGKDGLLHYRHINALYLAIRIRDLAPADARICEFGGGLGLAAFYLRKFGRHDVTIFDLPEVNLLSGHFLACSLGEEAVCLEGEASRCEAIKIRANWNCADEPDKSFQIVANQDSFPEIGRRIFDAYAEQISRITAGHLLSINHEGEQIIHGAERLLHASRLLSADTRFQRV